MAVFVRRRAQRADKRNRQHRKHERLQNADNRFKKISGQRKPVSYTHLDVYKRQGQDRVHQIRIRTPDERGLLRLAHFGGGDHLHRLGDLGGVLNRLDASAYVARAGHEKL